MGVNYQCGTKSCRQRYNFRKKLEEYVFTPRSLTKERLCGQCKRGTLNECDKHVRKWNRMQPTCNCGLIPYPHRKGSTIDCEHHPEFDPWS